ncbi:MAG: integration host factor subunit beta [Planctomycetes bacterium]|nr:integration host factor subunit beta [Planctomycetota bacterium]
MTKKQIVRQIATELNIDQTLAKKVVQRCLDTIIDVLAKEGRIELRNFGVFEVKRRAARKARNPRTNEEVWVPPKKVVRFQAGKNVAKRLQTVGAESAN